MTNQAIVISTGEPAGIGPDISLAFAAQAHTGRFVFLGDHTVLRRRAELLDIAIEFQLLTDTSSTTEHEAGIMQLVNIPTDVPVVPGILDQRNAIAVTKMLDSAGRYCIDGRCAAVVTAPVQKSVIAAAGIPFTGHTEFFTTLTGAPQAVMLLAREDFRVALVTTHLPLRHVANAITADRLRATVRILHSDLQNRFGITAPRIMVLGLNPHAGESGTLGTEERDIIIPVLRQLKAEGIGVIGPRPADTAFTTESLSQCDVVLAMYHDQGLTPLKAQGFGEIVNVTLGLPIIRTSVDHGTALDLAGSGLAKHDSLVAAVRLAQDLVKMRKQQ